MFIDKIPQSRIPIAVTLRVREEQGLSSRPRLKRVMMSSRCFEIDFEATDRKPDDGIRHYASSSCREFARYRCHPTSLLVHPYRSSRKRPRWNRPRCGCRDWRTIHFLTSKPSGSSCGLWEMLTVRMCWRQETVVDTRHTHQGPWTEPDS